MAVPVMLRPGFISEAGVRGAWVVDMLIGDQAQEAGKSQCMHKQQNDRRVLVVVWYLAG